MMKMVMFDGVLLDSSLNEDRIGGGGGGIGGCSERHGR